MAASNLTGDEKQSFVDMLCAATLTDGLHIHLICLSAINILLSITAILGNTLIIAALQKESSLHPPSKLLFRCLAITDLCAGLIAEPLTVAFWLAIVKRHREVCRLTLSSVIAGYVLLPVSLWTVTAISVDRLLALLLGLRYRQVVTFRRTLVIVVIFWATGIIGTGMFFWHHRITFWGGCISMAICITISIASYTKIFLTLRRRKSQVRNRNQQSSNQRNGFNVVCYRKVIYSALWLQLTLAFCVSPYAIVIAVTTEGKISPSGFLARQCAITLVFLNSSLNPILYCWKIEEVRQAVKDIIRQVLRLA